MRNEKGGQAGRSIPSTRPGLEAAPSSIAAGACHGWRGHRLRLLGGYVPHGTSTYPHGANPDLIP